VPERTVNRSAGSPAQTSVTAFQSTGTQRFVADFHWSSTEFSSTYAWELDFFNGFQYDFFDDKVFTNCVRAFRKLAL
jgi:hypothetical protein